MPRLRRTLDAISTTNRSQITNGSRLLDKKVDGRSPAARRFRDVLRSLEAEFEVVTAGDTALIRTAAQLMIESEALQSARARGEPVDADAIVKLAGMLRRVVADLRKRVASSAPTASAPLSLLDHYRLGDDHDEDAEEEA